MPGKQGENAQGDGANGKLNASQERPTAQDEEQLSAYLDDELNAAERATLEQRLAEDATLRRALGQLRQTRSLLRAMGVPAAPRSFALPEVGALDAPDTARARSKSQRDTGADATGPLRTMPRVQIFRRGTGAARAIPRPAPMARAAQWLGTLVAVLGVALLLGATFPAHAPSITSEPAASTVSRQHAPSSGATGAPSGTAGTFGPSINQHDASPSTSAPATPTPTTSSSSTGDSSGAPVVSLTQVWLPALGVLLLVGGVILFAYGRFSRPRR